MMTRQAATLLLGAGLALGMGAGAAAPAAPVGPSPVSPREIVVIPLGGRPGGAELRVRGIPVMRWLGRRAMSRLQGVAARLEPLLPPPTAVTARATRRSAQLIVDGRVVITITRAELGRQGLPGPMVE
ncbi:MAG: hypothetical protein QN178_07935, partial [Armatimonadota bacterium]|nr:hypothetical protein [Armatimonadota bacterium]